MSDKLIIVNSELGGSGKSYISSNIIDQLRFQGKECAGYLLDVEQKATLDRLGQKDDFGVLLNNNEQDPIKGIKSFDILNQNNNENLAEVKQVKQDFLDSLAEPYEYSVYDFPGQGRTSFMNIFGKGELEDILQMVDKDIFIVIPVSEKKSLPSVSKLKEFFTFSGDYEALNDRIHFVVIHNPIKEDTDLSLKQFEETQEHRNLLTLGSRYRLVGLKNILPNVINAMSQKPFTHYFDFDKKQAYKDRVPEGMKWLTLGQMLIRILCNETGFYQIVKTNFIDKAE